MTTTHTAVQGISFPRPQATRRPAVSTRAAARIASPARWMERLAAWAERQPLHHRMGSYQR